MFELIDWARAGVKVKQKVCTQESDLVKKKKKEQKIQHHTVPTWSPTVVLSRPNVA